LRRVLVKTQKRKCAKWSVNINIHWPLYPKMKICVSRTILCKIGEIWRLSKSGQWILIFTDHFIQKWNLGLLGRFVANRRNWNDEESGQWILIFTDHFIHEFHAFSGGPQPKMGKNENGESGQWILIFTDHFIPKWV